MAAIISIYLFHQPIKWIPSQESAERNFGNSAKVAELNESLDVLNETHNCAAHHDVFGEFLHFCVLQISTNVRHPSWILHTHTITTIATTTQAAVTPRARFTARVMRATLEMESCVEVSKGLFSCPSYYDG